MTEYGFDDSLTNFEGLGPRVLPLCDAHDGSTIKRHDLGSAKLGRGPIEWEDRSIITQRFRQGDWKLFCNVDGSRASSIHILYFMT